MCMIMPDHTPTPDILLCSESVSVWLKHIYTLKGLSAFRSPYALKLYITADNS